MSREYTASKPELSVALLAHYCRGRIWYDEATLHPVQSRRLLTRPFALLRGRGRVNWVATVPVGSRLRVDLLRAADDTVLLRHVQPGEALSEALKLTGEATVRLRMVMETWEGAFPTLRVWRLQ